MHAEHRALAETVDRASADDPDEPVIPKSMPRRRVERAEDVPGAGGAPKQRLIHQDAGIRQARSSHHPHQRPLHTR